MLPAHPRDAKGPLPSFSPGFPTAAGCMWQAWLPPAIWPQRRLARPEGWALSEPLRGEITQRRPGPPLHRPTLACFFPAGRVGAGTNRWSITPAGGGVRPGTLCPQHPGSRTGSGLWPGELAQGDKEQGRAWPQPDPISEEFERGPFVQVFVRSRGGRGFKARLIKCASGKKNQSQMWLEWLGAQPPLQPLPSAAWPFSPEVTCSSPKFS